MTHQPCTKKHLHRYLAEFELRFKERATVDVNDTLLTEKALRSIGGKRLTYRRIDDRA